jgi:hypothetical protein
MGDDGHVQIDLPLDGYDMLYRDQHYDFPPTYDAVGLPFKTLDEYERHYYITNQEELQSLWLMVSNLEDALAVSARMNQ